MPAIRSTSCWFTACVATCSTADPPSRTAKSAATLTSALYLVTLMPNCVKSPESSGRVKRAVM
eukprot:3940089-Rhodomonas_salina.2